MGMGEQRLAARTVVSPLWSLYVVGESKNKHIHTKIR